MKYAKKEYLTLKLPDNVHGERILFKRYTAHKEERTAAEIDGETYQVIARESSSEQFLYRKDRGTVGPVVLSLECRKLSFSSKEIEKMLPQIELEHIHSESRYLSCNVLAKTHPMSSTEYAKIRQEGGFLHLDKHNKMYIGRASPALVRDSLLLLRSIHHSSSTSLSQKETTKEMFSRFFPEEAFQIVEKYVEKDQIEIEKVENALQQLGHALD
ncbi:hypothetical protein NECID01_0357 [Nematocida sp. AWRm77]|nr:hypothetical protein NECID01_0357 [Nematocida sp. AWRm77]